MGLYDDIPDAPDAGFQDDLAMNRDRFASELSDPEVASRFYQRVENEVGDQTPEEQQAFIESVMNRAHSRGMTLEEAMDDRGYFPPASFRPTAAKDYTLPVQGALKGTNVARRATGNESGGVHSGGAGVTYAGAGGERFVRENSDVKTLYDDIPGEGIKGMYDDIPDVSGQSAAAMPGVDTERVPTKGTPYFLSSERAMAPEAQGMRDLPPASKEAILAMTQGIPSAAQDAVNMATPEGAPGRETALAAAYKAQHPEQFAPLPPEEVAKPIADYLTSPNKQVPFQVTDTERQPEIPYAPPSEPWYKAPSPAWMQPAEERVKETVKAAREIPWWEEAKGGVKEMFKSMYGQDMSLDPSDILPEGRVKDVAAGGVKGLDEFAKDLATTDNMAIALVMPEGLVGKAAGLYFTYEMANALPDQWQEFKDAKTLEEKTKIGTKMVATAVTMGLAGKHGTDVKMSDLVKAREAVKAPKGISVEEPPQEAHPGKGEEVAAEPGAAAPTEVKGTESMARVQPEPEPQRAAEQAVLTGQTGRQPLVRGTPEAQQAVEEAIRAGRKAPTLEEPPDEFTPEQKEASKQKAIEALGPDLEEGTTTATNIGHKVGEDYVLDHKKVLEIAGDVGLNVVQDHELPEEPNAERASYLKFDNATPEKLEALRERTQQTAIADQAGDKMYIKPGEEAKAKAEGWDKYNAEYFREPPPEAVSEKAPVSEAGKPTETRNLYTEEQMKARGMEPDVKEKAAPKPDVEKAAAGRLTEAPLIVKRILDDPKSKGLDPEENEILRQHAEGLEKTVDRLGEEINKNPDPEKTLTRNAVHSALKDTYRALIKSGTKLSDAFRARMAERDVGNFSRTKLESDLQASTGGKPLSKKEQRELDRIHKDIQKTKEAVGKREAKLKTGDRGVKVEDPKGFRKAIRDAVPGAKERLRKELKKFTNVGIIPQEPNLVHMARDASILVADLMDRGITSVPEISRKILEQFKDFAADIKPHIEQWISKGKELMELRKPQGPIGKFLEEQEKFEGGNADLLAAAKKAIGDQEQFFSKHFANILERTGKQGTPEQVEVMAHQLVNDVAKWLKKNPKFTDYYDKDMKQAHDNIDEGLVKEGQEKLTTDEKALFQLLNGVWSNSTDLERNTWESIQGVKHWRETGNLKGWSAKYTTEFEPIKQRVTTAWRADKRGPFNIVGGSFAIKHLHTQMLGKLLEEKGIQGTIKFLEEMVPIKEVNELAKTLQGKKGLSSVPGIKAAVRHATGQDALIPRAFLLGKKVGAYTLNNLGDHRYNTVDVWESRVLASQFKGWLEKNAGIAATPTEINLYEDFVGHFNNRWRELYGPMDSSALQAARWYFMKDAASKAGWRSGEGTVSEYAKDYFDKGVNIKTGAGLKGGLYADREAGTRGGKPSGEGRTKKLEKGAERLAAEAAKIPDATAFERAREFIEPLGRAAFQANKRIAARGPEFASGPSLSPEALKDTATVGAYHIANGIIDKAEWATHMIKDIGKQIKPHIEQAWRATVDMVRKASAIKDASLRKAWLKRTIASTEEFQRRVTDEDITPLRPKRLPMEYDPEMIRAAGEHLDAKERFEAFKEKRLRSQEGLGKKVARKLVAVGRATKLTGIGTLRKIGGAAIQRPFVTAAEEVAGKAWSAVPGIGKIVKGAPTEAPDIGSLKKYPGGVARGIKQAGKILTGRMEAGEHIPEGYGLDIPGRTHQVLKNPIKQAEYDVGLERATKWAVKEYGADKIDQPHIQEQIHKFAKNRGDQAIWMRQNIISGGWTHLIQHLERTSEKGGKGRQTAAFAGAQLMKALLPIVKVPTNVAIETARLHYGLPVGLAKAGHALIKGIDTLKPEDKDIITRNLKAGSIGAALFYLGAVNPDAFGGFYDPDEKKKDKKAGRPKHGEARLFGVDIPSWVFHSGVGLTLQSGATFGNAMRDKHGIVGSAGKSARGILENVPFVNELYNITGAAMGPKWQRERAQQRLVSGWFGSAILRDIAQWTDTHDANGEPIKRYPKGFVQGIEMGVPGLRQTVPTTKESKSKVGF